MQVLGVMRQRERYPSLLLTTPCTVFSVQSSRYHASSRVTRLVSHCLVSLVFAVLLILCYFSTASGSAEMMSGPAAKSRRPVVSNEIETSVPRIVLLGTLTLFQKFISPVDGDRCGFTPSCSAFAREAVSHQGAVQGVLVSADRLMRCTFFKEPGTDYLLLPNGRLFDPLQNNLLSNP
ncbi:MAG: membrane protein insertion efficiency factor YidD [Deltaproteobacteria bacterium]|nr:membrane protein insertion efficiency factor YidD [Deltaproteobacteria bacterium]